MLAVKSVFFTIVFPGTIAVLIPYVIVSRSGSTVAAPWMSLRILSLVPITLGAAVVLRCVWDFAAKGRGTLAPIDPPKELVVQGLYRYVRNPMYLGVFLLLGGQVLFFQSVALVVYTVLWFSVVHLLVVAYEEPSLRRRFGESYVRYTQSVRRWWPTTPRNGAA